MIKHGYSQTGGSSVVENNSYENFDVYYADFKIGDKIINKNQNTIAIKIDVEGHEINVLNGLKNTLENKIIIQIEIFNKFSKVIIFNLIRYKIIFEIKKDQIIFIVKYNLFGGENGIRTHEKISPSLSKRAPSLRPPLHINNKFKINFFFRL